jgi:SAM-dependent methyltransferase
MRLQFPGECPVCRSTLLTLARRLETPRAGEVDLFYCMECESLCSPFAPTRLNGPTLNHHKRVFDRNQAFTDTFLGILRAMLPLQRSKRVLDVGCGIGSFLHGLSRHGIPGVGYDLDEEACAYGRATYGLDLRGEVWTHASGAESVQLITCIMVLEHLTWPRPLLFELIKGARRHACPAFISVPWFNRSWWHHLNAPLEPDSPLAQPWVHVTHFSEKGFVMACQGMGASRVERLTGGPWPGYLIWT